MSGATLFDRIWAAHQVAELPGGRAVLAIDRMMLHDVTGGFALRDLVAAGERPRLGPERVLAVADHAISTAPGRGPRDSPNRGGGAMIASLEESCRALGYRYVPPDEDGHGIVHVIGPEQGFILPGTTHVCGDSHTCTLGAFGALAFAVGASEVATVLRRGALIVERPKALRVRLAGRPGDQVFAKDVALRILALHGVEFALGRAIEFAGPVVDGWSMEARMTLCNMAAEMGTRYALIAPDETTFEALGRTVRLPPAMLDRAVAAWRALRSDPDAAFDREIAVELDGLAPQVSWGTTPMQTVGIDQAVPPPADAAARRALDYMGLEPGRAMADIAVDAAFIGSCTNARIEDLRAAAVILRGRKVAPGVRAMCTPGSMQVRARAEAEGLDRIFEAAGFAWRKSGCSNCAGREGPIWQGLRVISSTNRNFENRQGPGTRTHLASPATVAASAVTGRLADPRSLA